MVLLSALLDLQQPLRREDLSCQPLFRRRGLIERLGQRLEDGFHDVVRIAAIHQIHVQIKPGMGDESLEKVFE